MNTLKSRSHGPGRQHGPHFGGPPRGPHSRGPRFGGPRSHGPDFGGPQHGPRFSGPQNGDHGQGGPSFGGPGRRPRFGILKFIVRRMRAMRARRMEVMHAMRAQRHADGFGHGRGPGFGPGMRRPRYNVPVNVTDRGDSFLAQVYVPGFAREDISISVTDNVLHLTGERTPDDDAPDFLVQEFPIKGFERWFELSEDADQSAVTAKVVDGMLEVTVPKVPAAQRATVSVEVQ